MWRGEKSFQSLLPWELQWFLFLWSLRRYWPCPKEFRKSRIWKWNIGRFASGNWVLPWRLCRRTFPLCPNVDEWLSSHVSLEGHWRGFSRSRDVSGSHIIPHFLFGNHYQNRNCVWNHTASTSPLWSFWSAKCFQTLRETVERSIWHHSQVSNLRVLSNQYCDDMTVKPFLGYLLVHSVFQI